MTWKYAKNKKSLAAMMIDSAEFTLCSRRTLKFCLLAVLAPSLATGQVTTPEYDHTKHQVTTTMANGVDARTGAFSYSNLDLSIGSGGSALALNRTYTSDHRADPVAPFGPGTSHSYNVYLAIHATDYWNGKSHLRSWSAFSKPRSVVIGSSRYMFNHNTVTSDFERQPGIIPANLELTQVFSGGVWHDVYVFTHYTERYKVYFDATDWTSDCAMQNLNYNFDTCILASRIEYPNGQILSFKNESATTTGPSKSRLKEVTNSRGYGLRFSYKDDSTTGAANDDKFLIDSVVGFRTACTSSTTVDCAAGVLPSATYTYTPTGNALKTYRNGEGEGFNYGYNLDYQMVSAVRSDLLTTNLFVNTYVAGNSTYGGEGVDYEWYPVSQQQDDRGKTWTFDYELDGNCPDPGGECWEVVTDSSVTDPMNGVTTFVFGLDYMFEGMPTYHNQPTTVTDPSGKSVDYDYSFRYRLFSVTYPSGRNTEYIHSSNTGVLVQVVNEAAPGSGLPDQVTTYTYPGTGCSSDWPACVRPISITDPKSNVTDLKWDSSHGGLLAVLSPANDNGDRAIVRYTYGDYSAEDGVTSELAWMSVPSVYLVEEQQRCLVAATNIDFVCPANDRLTSQNVYTASTSAARSAFELSQFVVDPSGLSISTSFEYDQVGNNTSVDGPLSTADVTTSFYDSHRRLTATVYPKPDAQSDYPAELYTYDPIGNVTIFEEGYTPSGLVSGFVPIRSTCTDYDAGGRTTTVTGPGASSSTGACPNTSDNYTSHSTITYDNNGRQDVVTRVLSAGQGVDRKTKTVYFANGQIQKEIRAHGTSLQQDYKTYTYNNDKQIASVADANGNLTSYLYDGHGRLDRATYPDTSYEELDYDSNDNLTSKRVRDGRSIVHTYDALNQQKTKTVPGADVSDPTVYSFEYDLAGRLKWDDYWSTRQNYYYDDADRLTSKTHENGLMPVSYQYDAASNVKLLTYPDGWEVAFDYDILSRVIEAKEGTATENENPNRVLATIGYDDFSRRDSISYANGTSANLVYKDRGDLYVHDMTFTAATINYDFTHNKLRQTLTNAVSDPAMIWLPAAGSSSTTYQSNNLNQYSSTSGKSFDYDDNGNLTDADNGRTYTYDAANGLSRAWQNSSEIAHYIHYADGNRRYKSAGSATTKFYYAGNQEILETGNVNSDRRKRYVRLPGSIDEPLLMLDYTASQSNPSEEWAHQDRNGSVVAVSDDTGSILEKFAYSPYGLAGPSAANMPFRYTGQKLDSETGLYYYKARYYDSILGRFLQTDPIGYEDQMNLYAYVANDPINSSDPSGTATCGSLEGEKCDKALDAADQGRENLLEAAGGIEAVADRLGENKDGDVSSDDQVIIDAVNEKFGDAFKGADGLRSLATALRKMASRIGPRGSGMLLNQGDNQLANNGQPVLGYVVSGQNYSVYLNDAGLGRSSDGLKKTILHESAHLTVAGSMMEWYGREQISLGVRRGFAMQNNADSYACLVVPGVCGY